LLNSERWQRVGWAPRRVAGVGPRDATDKCRLKGHNHPAAFSSIACYAETVRRLLSPFLAAAIFATGHLQARQLGPVDETRIESKHLTLTMSTSTTPVAPGKLVSLYVDVAPKAKMHVYAPDQSDYIPIELKLETAPGFRAQAVQFPPAEQFYFEPLKETHRVYSKPFRITQPITIARSAGSTLTVKGTIRYQACDDAICYLPQTIPVTWKVAVKNGAR